MVATVQSVGSPIARLALLIDEGRIGIGSALDAPKHEFLWVVKGVGKEEQAMKLRAAQLLAWCKSRDVSELGFPSWTAFVKEMSPWRGSRTRDYLRLVESRLDVIKEAASKNEIDLAVATRAPRALGNEASREAQVAWLLEATLATLPARRRPFMEILSGEEMGRVRKARDLAEILIGWDAPLRTIDDFLLDCHARKLTGEQILDQARAVPPKPERLGKTVPEWKDDPSVSMLGPWVEPPDIHDAVAKIRAMEVLLDQRRVLLGIAYLLIRDLSLWKCVQGCRSLEELCLAHLEVGQRSFQRYAHEGIAYLWHARLRKEISVGQLTVDRAMFAVDHLGARARGPASGIDRALQTWLALVRRLGRTEMERAWRQERDHGVRLREVYAAALAMAREVEVNVDKEGNVRRNDEASAIGGATGAADTQAVGGATGAADTQAVGGATAVADEAPTFGTTAENIAAHLLAKGATGRLLVALRDDADRRSARTEPDSIRVRRGLLAAADYLLDTVELPKLQGPRKAIGRDRYVCQNPRCRRRTLRVHHHHLVEKQHGGTDDPWNIVTLCPACHLRGIHSKRVSVDRFDDWLVWTWPDREAVLVYSPVE